MRDGLPVVALVVAIISLVVASVGFVSRGTSSLEDAPEEAIEKAERRLDTVERQRRAMRKEMAEIAAQAARAIELGTGSSKASVDPAELERSVGEAVGAAMRSALRAEAARVGAPPPKATPQDMFADMLQELINSLGLEQGKAAALRSALVRLRTELNQVFRTHKGAERERQAGLARSRTDASIRRILSPVEFDKFAKWRKETKNSYAKRFFGQ